MNIVSQVNGELRFGTYLHWAGWVAGEFNKGAMVHANASALEKATLSLAPLAFALKLVNSVPSYMSLEFF